MPSSKHRIATKYSIYPLLNEYFYNETETIAEVLNCAKSDLNNIDENWLNILEKAQKNDEK